MDIFYSEKSVLFVKTLAVILYEKVCNYICSPDLIPLVLSNFSMPDIKDAQ